MRPIKFRAWVKRKVWMEGKKLSGSMLEVSDIDFDTQEVGVKEIHSYVPFNEIELMQFTGLHDKTGHEIWEGDIVKWHREDLTSGGESIITSGGIGEISWIKESAQFGFTKPRKFGHFVMEDDELEVLGNVYENPELIT